ncbi:MAG TPA: alanine dehydrogenase [Burkholderiaceae bacterium]|nr:alanine dehydrogenase [Burkholderiaceae bacterium]
MLIGVPKEIKVHEYRVGMTPAAVREAVHHGHAVLIQSGAGLGIGCDDQTYMTAGAQIAPDAPTVFAAAQMIVKVKEPQPEECRLLRPGQVLFTYLHLAPDPQQTDMLMRSGCIAIGYETITDERGGLPLLAPMSEVAGRMAIQVGAVALQKSHEGRGVLLGGVPGVPPGKVTIIGGGVVGTNAAKMAIGLGADVTVLDRSLPRLQALDDIFLGRLRTEFASMDATEQAVYNADLVIGAVLIPGAAAPKLIKRSELARMKPGAVVVDVSIDQGGCFESSRPTTHANPIYVLDGIVHYCVANMPGAVARTSTFALNNATLPFILALAAKGWRQACRDDPHLRAGLQVHAGLLTHRAVAAAQGKTYTAAESVLGEDPSGGSSSC